MSTGVPLSTFVSATIFPVPIQNDYSFDMNIEAEVNSKFKYQLIDFNGNVIYSQSFEVPKDHDEVHTIRTNQPIPKGVLINYFSFPDGSSFSITTTH